MFKKFYKRWQLRKILTNQKINRRMRTLELIALVDENNLESQFSSLNKTMVRSVYRSIILYTRKLKEINYQIARKVPISSDMQSNAISVVSLDTFFTDEDNYYVEVAHSLMAFKSECTKLMDALAQADQAEYGYFEHTNRVLTTVLQNLEEVLKMIAVQLYE